MNTTTTTSENTTTKEANTSAVANIPDDPVASVEPDSLIMNNNNNTEEAGTETAPETEDEIVQAFENEESDADRGTPMPPSVMSMSRASVDSQRSVTFFVDLKDENLMARSAIVTPRPVSGRRTRSQQGDRMTQSMYVRSDSQSSGVSFYVDLREATPKPNRSGLIHSMSREEADPDVDELSEDMRVKSRMLLAKNLEQTKAFYKKLKGYVDFLGTPSYSKDELRQKRRLAENISRLMFEEEQKLKKGQSLSSLGDLDKYLLGQHSGLLRPLRPVSAYTVGDSSKLSVDEKPVLRRERTFDMDPKPSTSNAKLVEVNIDTINNTPGDFDNETGNRSQSGFGQAGSDEPTLHMFQQQRLYHTMRLKREIAKLEKMEKEIAHRTVDIGAGTPEPKPRQCWTQTSTPIPSSRPSSSSSSMMSSASAAAGRPQRPSRKRDDSKTTFKNVNGESGQHSRFRLHMTDSADSQTPATWFIPGGPGDTNGGGPNDPVPAPRSSRPNSGQYKPRPTTANGTTNNSQNNNYAQKSQGIQTGNSLFRQFQEKKDKAIYCHRDRPQAYFIECDEKRPESSTSSSQKQRPKSAIEIVRKSHHSKSNNKDNGMTTTIIDLETDTLPKEKNLQEALKQKRPDYIAKTKNREQDRLARSMVNNSHKQSSVKYNSKQIAADILPSKVKGSAFRAKSVYDPPLASGPKVQNNSHVNKGQKSKIPTSSAKSNAGGSPGDSRPTSAANAEQQNGGKIQNGHHNRNNSETVTLVSRPRPSVTCQDVRRSANAGGSGGSEGQTNAKKMALNRSRAIKASQ